MKFPLDILGNAALKTGIKVEGESPEIYYKHTEQDYPGGYFPIGSNAVWHGGVHLFAPAGTFIHAIADGQIVAVRLGEETTASKYYGSNNFLLLCHKFKGIKYYCLFMHVHWEPLTSENGVLREIPWVKGSVEKEKLFSEFKKGNVVSINEWVKEGDKLWTVGQAGSSKIRASMIHWEIFSEDILPEIFGETNQPENWEKFSDPDSDFHCDQDCYSKVMKDVDKNADGKWGKKEVEDYFKNTNLSKPLRNYACKFIKMDSVNSLKNFINTLSSIRYLAFFGHCDPEGPFFFWTTKEGIATLPSPSDFESSSFRKNAYALFASCNSKDYAKKFTKYLDVKSVGVEGTSFYGETEISAGRIFEKAEKGTSIAWEYSKDAIGLIESRSYSLNQTFGFPFLRKK